ncbi:MAG: MFS transporter [Caulobacteraceae bacterium]|nr:MFS transporter [Caulobacteraceae bacterium]
MTTATDQSASDARLPTPALLAFAMPGVCIGALAVALPVYLPHYYAGHFGLALPAIGLAFMAVRLIDTLIDPLLGVAMDRTRSRLGRYRPWLAAGAPVLMLAVYMLFNPQGGISYAYLVGWLLAYYIGASLIVLSHASWASVIASRYHERSRVFGAIQLVSIIGAAVALILPIAMARHDGSSGSGDVGAMGWFIFWAAPAGVALALARTPERIVPEQKGEKFTLKDYWEMVSRPDMRRIIIADFCLAMGPGWMAALYLFYFHDARGFTIADASKLLLIYVAAGVAGAAALSFAAIRLGKHRTLMGASTGYSLGLIALAFLPKGQFPLAALFMFVMGFLASGFPLLDRAMVADVGDAVRLEQGKHRVGLLYAMITTSQKVAGALSIGLSFVVLGWIGYQAKEGSVNSPAAIHGMELVYLIGPVFFVMLGGACFIGYKLDSRRHADIRAQLERRDAMVPEAAILEGLSGDQGVPVHIVEPI